MTASSNRWQILPYWRTLLVVFAPILLLPIPLVSGSPESRCSYVIILMALFWMTEAVPLAITALIPLVGFPMLGVMSTGELCLVYMKETNMMFLGGLTVAIAVEHCNLHKRIALFVILHVGQSPRRLMFGFMFTTMFLSMWISNTASTAMMVPIVDAIIRELYRKPTNEADPGEGGDEKALQGGAVSSNGNLELHARVDDENPMKEKRKSSTTASEASDDSLKEMAIGRIKPITATTEAHSEKTGDVTEAPRGSGAPGKDDEMCELTDIGSQMRTALLLSVAYSANIGGTGVVTGTTPNLILMATLKSEFPEPSGLTFASWMGYNIPGMILCVFLAWIWLQVYFMGCRGRGLGESTEERKVQVKSLIQRKYRDLGSITFHEAVVLTLFICLVFMWLFRSPEFVKGWAYWFVLAFGDIEVDDATPVMLIVLLLFIIPKKLDFWIFRDPNDPLPVESTEACLTWQVVQQKIPWGVVLLLGGGFAMAEAADASGLSVWLGSQMEALDVLPVEATVFVISLMTCMVTEVASNTATASILMPVLTQLSIGIEVNPLYLMLPCAVCCSYAFMLPVATPPNAIVFAAANMRTVDMMKVGLIMNVLCVMSVTLMINTLGVAMFDLHTFPDWANTTHSLGAIMK